MIKYLKSLASLLYPELCIACLKHEPVHDNILCHICWKDTPWFSDIGDSRYLLEERFPLIYGENVSFYGLFLYSKSGGVQNILRQIKYYGKGHLAYKLGQILGTKISSDQYDALIPVPLHYKKERRRGYNQTELIAKGIQKVSKIQIIKTALEKKVNTGSQTQMDRAARHMSVSKSFGIRTPLMQNIARVLLIDDVVTTGATLDVCTTLLKKDRDLNLHVDYAFLAMSISS